MRNELRVLGWLRWKQFQDEAVYWLRVLGYQPDNGSLSSRAYILYLLGIGAIWVGAMWTWAHDQAHALGGLLSGTALSDWTGCAALCHAGPTGFRDDGCLKQHTLKTYVPGHFVHRRIADQSSCTRSDRVHTTGTDTHSAHQPAVCAGCHFSQPAFGQFSRWWKCAACHPYSGSIYHSNMGDRLDTGSCSIDRSPHSPYTIPVGLPHPAHPCCSCLGPTDLPGRVDPSSCLFSRTI